MMGSIRRPAVAGAFYPADPTELVSMVDRYLAAADRAKIDVEPRMVIVPHAGYVYSGSVAATAYATVPPQVGPLVLMGPSHFVRIGGIAVTAHDAFETPLGVVTVDDAMSSRVGGLHGVTIDDTAHRTEHSLEVQLPFLQRVLADPTMLPLLTGDIEASAAAVVLEEALTEDGFGVISSDLSHYLDYEAARRRDAATAQAIVDLRWEDVEWDDACGRTGLQAALSVAAARGWKCRLLDLRNSGDTAGPHDRVVGYGAFAIGPDI